MRKGILLSTAMTLGTLVGTALVPTVTNAETADDFSLCDGLTGAAFGICRGGLAAGCDQDVEGEVLKACEEIESQFEMFAGTDAPWLITERIVFVTSTTLVPGTDFGSLAEADLSCQTLADQAVLPGSYQA